VYHVTICWFNYNSLQILNKFLVLEKKTFFNIRFLKYTYIYIKNWSTTYKVDQFLKYLFLNNLSKWWAKQSYQGYWNENVLDDYYWILIRKTNPYKNKIKHSISDLFF